MTQPPTLFPKPHPSARLPGDYSAARTIALFPRSVSSQHATEVGNQQQVFRTKRKHVLKACDRCRVKKTKCDGNQPCYRCAAYNHPCLFRERKAMQTKAYSRGFVEMLESHHALVVKALQQLYTHCVNNKCFPGDPIDVTDGYPLTHAILDRLGLIKQAEESPEEMEDVMSGPFQRWRARQTSPNSANPDFSPELAYPLETSSPSSGDSVSSSEFDTAKSEVALGNIPRTYRLYHRSQPIVPFEEDPHGAQIMHFNHAISIADLPLEGECQPARVDGESDAVDLGGCIAHAARRDLRSMVSVQDPHSVGNGTYPSAPGFVYQVPNGGFAGIQHQDFWAPGL